jgi:hypothetical protein
MSGLIAFCKTQSCGTVFIVNNLIGGTGTVNLKIENVGPCPVCNGYGKIPDGEYQLGESIATFIKGPQESIEVLNKVKSILESFKIQEAPFSKEEIIEEVEKISPRIALFFKNAPTSSVLYWITFIMAFISFVIDINDKLSKNVDDIKSDKLTEMFIEHLNEDKKLRQENDSLKAVKPIVKYISIGRNDLCHCKSGLMFKNCCRQKRN